MMNKDDLITLGEMNRQVQLRTGGDIGKLSDRLLQLRDRLTFQDDAWYHSLTQHIVTLDSASTFKAQNDAEQRKADEAVQDAFDNIIRLVTAKLKRVRLW